MPAWRQLSPGVSTSSLREPPADSRASCASGMLGWAGVKPHTAASASPGCDTALLPWTPKNARTDRQTDRQTDRTTAVLQLLQQAQCQGMQTRRVNCQLSSNASGRIVLLACSRATLAQALVSTDICSCQKTKPACLQVAARALQLHPTEPDLWIRAAAWEFDRRANAAAARCSSVVPMQPRRFAGQGWSTMSA